MTVTGTLLSARSDGGSVPETASSVATDGGETADEPATKPAVESTTGGEGRVTVTVPVSEAKPLLAADRGQLFVLPRGTGREYELAALLRRGGSRFRRLSVSADSTVSGRTIADIGVRTTYGVVVLAVKPAGGRWRVAPSGSMTLAAGDELYVVGKNDDLDRFQEVIA